MDVQKTPKGPLFYHFRHYAIYRRLQKNFEKKSVKFFLNIFFSLFRHSVTSFRQKNFLKAPPSLFLEFCGKIDVEKYQKVPLSVFFRNCKTFVQFCFSPKGHPSIFLMICDRRDEKCQSVPLAPQSGPTFGFLGCFRREYFDTLKSFCYF